MAELNVNALEFVPSSSGSSTQLVLKEENSVKIENHTGTKPKRNVSNHNQKFFANNNNWHKNHRSNRENDSKNYRRHNNYDHRKYPRRDFDRKERYSQDVNESNSNLAESDQKVSKKIPERKRKVNIFLKSNLIKFCLFHNKSV
jgi:hypothetical protein